MRTERNHQSDRLKIIASISVVSFAVALAVVIGQRLSNESLAVLAGALCGVGAAIPTSLLIIAVTRRTNQPTNQLTNQPTNYQTNQPFPPVVVVAPPGTQPLQLPHPHTPISTHPSPPRTFTIVGNDNDYE